MKFNLNTSLYVLQNTADTPIIPDVPTPDVGLNNLFFTGASEKSTLTAEEIKNLSVSFYIANPTENINYGNSTGYIWFCSPLEITDIKAFKGDPVDYQLISREDIVLNDDTIKYYCYRTTYEVINNGWTFSISFKGGGN